MGIILSCLRYTLKKSPLSKANQRGKWGKQSTEHMPMNRKDKRENAKGRNQINKPVPSYQHVVFHHRNSTHSNRRRLVLQLPIDSLFNAQFSKGSLSPRAVSWEISLLCRKRKSIHLGEHRNGITREKFTRSGSLFQQH